MNKYTEHLSIYRRHLSFHIRSSESNIFEICWMPSFAHGENQVLPILELMEDYGLVETFEAVSLKCVMISVSFYNGGPENPEPTNMFEFLLPIDFLGDACDNYECIEETW